MIHYRLHCGGSKQDSTAGRNQGGVREKKGRSAFGAFHLACDLKSGTKA